MIQSKLKPMLHEITQSQIMELIRTIHSDSTLSDEQKELIEQKLKDRNFITRLTSGSVGGGIGILIGKYLRLSTTAKILLAIAGFGVGRAIWNAIHNDTSKFQEYNNKLKVYEIR